MQLIVRSGRRRDLKYWVRSFIPRLLAREASLSLGTGDDDPYAPAVVARTSSGPDHVLQRTGTDGQARRALDRFQEELDSVGEAEFRRRYALPDR